MDNQILDSIIEITRQRDLDSLEHSLLTSISSFVPVNEIAIYKTSTENHARQIEQVVSLSVEINDTGKQNKVWDHEPKTIKADDALETCLSNAEHRPQNENNHTQILLPFICNETVTGAINITSDENITTYRHPIEKLVEIYGNYLTVLNQSERDKLTGLFNRCTFDKKLDRMLDTQRKKREHYGEKEQDKRSHIEKNASAWLVIADLDDFKQVNDTYGHIYGDEVLLTLSQKMKQCFRQSDLLFRFGGDEFVIILEPILPEMAKHALERFRNSIANHKFPLIGEVTVSIGYAKIKGGDYPPVILDRADRALYYAKESGRNCIYNYESLLKQSKLSDYKKRGAIDLFYTN